MESLAIRCHWIRLPVFRDESGAHGVGPVFVNASVDADGLSQVAEMADLVIRKAAVR